MIVAFHASPRRHAVAYGYVGFSDRPVYLTRGCRRLESICQHEAFQRYGVCPQGLKCVDVISAKLEKSPLWNQDLRVGTSLLLALPRPAPVQPVVLQPPPGAHRADLTVPRC